jgi:hypothetical protein
MIYTNLNSPFFRYVGDWRGVEDEARGPLSLQKWYKPKQLSQKRFKLSFFAKKAT